MNLFLERPHAMALPAGLAWAVRRLNMLPRNMRATLWVRARRNEQIETLRAYAELPVPQINAA
jgi:hypothetical protein